MTATYDTSRAGSSAKDTYKARHAVFGAELSNAMRGGDTVPVKVLGIVESDKPLSAEYNPDHPLANEQGYIYKPNVNVMEEMANMISASRAYQTNVQVADSSKQMLLAFLLFLSYFLLWMLNLFLFY